MVRLLAIDGEEVVSDEKEATRTRRLGLGEALRGAIPNCVRFGSVLGFNGY